MLITSVQEKKHFRLPAELRLILIIAHYLPPLRLPRHNLVILVLTCILLPSFLLSLLLHLLLLALVPAPFVLVHPRLLGPIDTIYPFSLSFFFYYIIVVHHEITFIYVPPMP